MTPTASGVLVRETGKISRDRSVNAGVRAMLSRQGEMGGRETAELAGIAVVPEARRRLERALTYHWREQTRKTGKTVFVDELVVGCGLHAAIYCGSRVAQGHEPPMAVGDAPGGIFAASERPSWYLNSRNRNGRNLPPLEAGGLNHVPGSGVQLAHVSMEKFHTNADLRYVIRTLLARAARVHVDAVADWVSGNYPGGYRYRAITERGRTVFARRTVDARGIQPVVAVGGGAGVLSFTDLMRLADEPFPLRGMGRVAVIGNGDSGKCAVEMLLGSGPPGHMSVAALDWVRQVDLFGGPRTPTTVEDWRAVERGRYQAIGSYLRPLQNGEQRLRTFQQVARHVRTLGGVLVNDRFYDQVVLCTGAGLSPSLPGLDEYMGEASPWPSGDGVTKVARKRDEVLAVGPRARLELTNAEVSQGLTRRPGLDVGLFRLGDRTASAAVRLQRPTPAP